MMGKLRIMLESLAHASPCNQIVCSSECWETKLLAVITESSWKSGRDLWQFEKGKCCICLHKRMKGWSRVLQASNGGKIMEQDLLEHIFGHTKIKVTGSSQQGFTKSEAFLTYLIVFCYQTLRFVYDREQWISFTLTVARLSRPSCTGILYPIRDAVGAWERTKNGQQ